jgi:hypothetical protein
MGLGMESSSLLPECFSIGAIDHAKLFEYIGDVALKKA